MAKYKILKKGTFESQLKFEQRVNELAFQGWKAISISYNGAQLAVLMEKM